MGEYIHCLSEAALKSSRIHSANGVGTVNGGGAFFNYSLGFSGRAAGEGVGAGGVTFFFFGAFSTFLGGSSGTMDSADSSSECSNCLRIFFMTSL